MKVQQWWGNRTGRCNWSTWAWWLIVMWIWIRKWRQELGVHHMSDWTDEWNSACGTWLHWLLSFMRWTMNNLLHHSYACAYSDMQVACQCRIALLAWCDFATSHANQSIHLCADCDQSPVVLLLSKLMPHTFSKHAKGNCFASSLLLNLSNHAHEWEDYV